MNCAGFETELARILDGDQGAPEAERLSGLRLHAKGCDSCRGSIDLLDLLALPAAERDLVEAPPEGYWTEFNRRVDDRRREAERRFSPARWQGLAAAAAVVMLAVVGGWVLGPLNTDPPAEPTPGAEIEQTPAGEAEPESGVAHATDSAALAPLESLADGPPLSSGKSDGSAAGGWLFPGTDELDEETSLKLLEWLREQNAAAEVG